MISKRRCSSPARPTQPVQSIQTVLTPLPEHDMEEQESISSPLIPPSVSFSGNTQVEMLIPALQQMHVSSPLTAEYKLSNSTRNNKPPTWGQIKQLSHQAHHLLNSQGTACTPETRFVAMLAVLACQTSLTTAATSTSGTYWAYFPDPPFLQFTSWGKQNVKIFTNNTPLMGGEADSFIKEKTIKNFNFQGQADLPPICFTFLTDFASTGCLPVNYVAFVTSSLSLATPPRPDIRPRKFWLLTMLTIGTDYNFLGRDMPSPQAFKNCQMDIQTADTYWTNINRNTGFPLWHQCVWDRDAFFF